MLPVLHFDKREINQELTVKQFLLTMTWSWTGKLKVISNISLKLRSLSEAQE